MAFPIERLLVALPPEKSVFLAKDPPMWPPPKGWEISGVYCSGFVLVRLDETGLGFLARWCAAFDPGQWWQSEEGCWTTDGNWAGAAYEQGQLNVLAQGDMESVVFELPQALFNSAWKRPDGRPQPVVMHLMRRPGEWSRREKEGRVEAAFTALLEQPSPPTAAEGDQSNDGIPRDSAALQLWEEEEDVQVWISMLQARLGDRATYGQPPAESLQGACHAPGGSPGPGRRVSLAYHEESGRACHGVSPAAPVPACGAEHGCGPLANVRFDACLGSIDVVD
mmetsp:Transcript_58694/g.182318  ORF Transcript_58694/g.182318 Transcript_58694/m.182318 type:complete len:280 (+) Transcript_58694:501-1340(+)